MKGSLLVLVLLTFCSVTDSATTRDTTATTETATSETATTGTAPTGTAATGTATTGTATTGTDTTVTSTVFTTFTGPTTAWTTPTEAQATTSTPTAESTAQIRNVKVKIGKTTFKCNFFLVFTGDKVNMDSSTMSCKGKGKAKKATKVKLQTPEGFVFTGLIKPPKAIMSLKGGDIFGEEYKNISTESKREYGSHCGGYNGEIEGRKNRGYTTTNVKLWPNAEVDWAFVSTGDSYKSYGFYTDAKIGYSEAAIKMVMKSMKRIEAATCIRFKRRNPVKGKPFLLVMREATFDKNGQATCQRNYINSNLKNKNINGAGKIFDSWWDGNCFSGAYVDGLGLGTPVRMVVSSTTLEDTENTVGLLVHEILHALGVGHTQKRPDRDNYITVNWNNIAEGGKSQYEKCTGNTCQTHSTEYDCSSIMHYMDTDFTNGQGKTMTAKDANKCRFAYNTKLTTSDITLLKKMYCDSSKKNLVTSPNYPQNYPASQFKEYPIKVSDGYVVEIVFSDFNLEDKTACSADWVQIMDGDGTELLKKSCGTTKPAKITSKTNRVKINFKSDSTYHYKGFRAEWKAVKKVAAVDGKWSNWGAWGTCTNNKDGKTQCSKQRYRYCNNPAKSGGGKDCEGSSTEKTACKASDMTNPTQHPNCVITAGWSAWGKGSKCSSTCKSTKTRTCTNPAPINSKACGGTTTESTTCTGGDCSSGTATGTIRSPNYPSDYPNSKDQTYPIKVESGSKIELTFTDFAIEDDTECSYDYVQVLDSDGKQLIKKCGATKPANVVSTSNTMTVKFHSDETVSAKGFSATWKKVAATQSGTIQSPNYPKSYSENTDKTYNLVVADGSKIKLTFTDFDVEHEDNCSYDYVQVFDTNGKSLAKLCGSGKPSPITSSGKTLKVKFHSDWYVNKKGFSATWTKI